MKITDSEIIKNGEQELIDAITADLDWGAIEDIFLKEHHLGIEEDIEYKSGDIIAIDNKIAYKLEFDVKVNISVLLDRDGDYISVKINDKKTDPSQVDTEVIAEQLISEESDKNAISDNVETDTPVNDNENQLDHNTNEIMDEKTTDLSNTDEILKTSEDGSKEDKSDIFKDMSDNDDEMEEKVDEVLESISKVG